MIRHRRLILLSFGVVALAALAGCGGSGTQDALPAARSAIDYASGAAAAERKIEAWAIAAERAADDADFHLRPPPSSTDLQLANVRGWRLGTESHDASQALREIADARSADEAEFMCQVFDYYLQYPNELGSEEAFAEYLYENIVEAELTSYAWEQFTDAAERFHLAILVAANAPEAVANTALATFCSYPG